MGRRQHRLGQLGAAAAQLRQLITSSSHPDATSSLLALAVHFFSGRPSDPPSDDFIMRNGGDAQQVEIGWVAGDPNHEGAAFFAFA